MPLIAPITFTSSDQRQSLTWCSHICPSDAEPTPALLHSTSTAPNASSVASRNASSDESSVTSVTTPMTSRPWSRSSAVGLVDRARRRCRRRPRCMPSSVKRSTSAWPMPPRAAGDDRDLARELLHAAYVPSGRARPRAAVVVLHELDEVAVEVLHVRHRDRPAVEVRRLHHRLAARGDGRVVERLHVVGVHVELPHRGAHVDRARRCRAAARAASGCRRGATAGSPPSPAGCRCGSPPGARTRRSRTRSRGRGRGR